VKQITSPRRWDGGFLGSSWGIWQEVFGDRPPGKEKESGLDKLIYGSQ